MRYQADDGSRMLRRRMVGTRYGLLLLTLAVILLLAVSGCGGSIPHTTLGAQMRETSSNGIIASGDSMHVGMHDKLKIRSMSEAAAAYEQANKTMAAVVILAKEASRPGISGRERTEKNREIDSFRQQYNREMEPVKAFFKKVERKVNKQ
jgi:hypothetical protein